MKWSNLSSKAYYIPNLNGIKKSKSVLYFLELWLLDGLVKTRYLTTKMVFSGTLLKKCKCSGSFRKSVYLLSGILVVTQFWIEKGNSLINSMIYFWLLCKTVKHIFHKGFKVPIMIICSMLVNLCFVFFSFLKWIFFFKCKV